MSRRRGKQSATRVMMRVQNKKQVGQPSSELLRFYRGLLNSFIIELSAL
jgi:hypothetical protein